MVSKRHKLFLFIWYFFCILLSLWTYLFFWVVFVGKTWYALCASYFDRLYWCFLHLCISLLKCLSISHSSLPVEQVLIFASCYCCSTFSCCKVYCFFSLIYALLHVFVLKILGGSEDSMLCTLQWNINPTLCMYLGEFPLIFFNIFLDPVCLLLFEFLLQSFVSSI